MCHATEVVGGLTLTLTLSDAMNGVTQLLPSLAGSVSATGSTHRVPVRRQVEGSLATEFIVGYH
jgi:hypothetical protein